MADRRVCRTKEKLDLGVSTLFALGTSFERVLRTIGKRFVRNWEIFDDGLHSLDEERVRELKAISKSKDVSYSVHGPICDLNLATLNGNLQRLVVKRLKKSIQNASLLGARSWVVHPGIHGALSWVHRGEDWRVNLENLREISRYAKSLGVEVNIENISAGLAILGHPRDFQRLYQESRDAPRMTFDIGHAHIKGEIDGYLKTLAKRIAHVHAHDNNGDEDRHLAVGSGTVPWRKALSSLLQTEFEGLIIVESVKAPFSSLSRIDGLVRSLQ